MTSMAVRMPIILTNWEEHIVIKKITLLSTSKKKKYNCKFQDEWKKSRHWLQSSSLGNDLTFCTLCCFMGTVCICYLDVNWLIPKISACRVRIRSLVASERSKWVTNFIFCRTGWYFSVSHLDDMFIILKSNINTDTSIYVYSREKSHD